MEPDVSFPVVHDVPYLVVALVELFLPKRVERHAAFAIAFKKAKLGVAASVDSVAVGKEGAHDALTRKHRFLPVVAVKLQDAVGVAEEHGAVGILRTRPVLHAKLIV